MTPHLTPCLARLALGIIVVVGAVGCHATPRPVTVVSLPRVFVGSVRCADGHVRVTRRSGYPTMPDFVECVR